MPFVVEWTHSDNIGINEHIFEYTYDGENFDTLLYTDSFEEVFAQEFQVSGITNLAQIRLTVSDYNGNYSTDISNTFSVIDNTPPVVELNSELNGSEYVIGDTLQLTWNDSDNVGVDSISLYYNANGNWISILEKVGNENLYNWVIPNAPTSNLKIRLIGFDLVGLTDTSEVEGIAINIAYPNIMGNDLHLRQLDYHAAYHLLQS